MGGWLARAGHPSDAGWLARLRELEAELARRPTNTATLVELARLHHNRATLGGGDAAQHVARAETHLRTLLSLQPRHAFGRALLGSATILTARDAFWPGTKIRRVREGLALMDAALEEFPDDAEARFTRASNNLFLPDLFERRGIVEADFAWLQERADRGGFPAEFRQYVCLFHGRAWQRWKQPERARRLWESGLTVDPDSKVADELRRELTNSTANTAN